MSTSTASDYEEYFNFLGVDKLIAYACQTGLEKYKNISSNDYNQKLLFVVGNITTKAVYTESDSWYYDVDIVEDTDCLTCLSNAANSAKSLCTSNNTKGVMVVRYKCFLMYTNQDFLGKPYIGFDKSSQNAPFCSGINLAIDGPQLVVRTLFDALLNDTKNGTTKFAWSYRAVKKYVVEGVVECRRDLDPDDCTTFLSRAATNIVQVCGAQTLGAYFLEGSNVRFAWKKF